MPPDPTTPGRVPRARGGGRARALVPTIVVLVVLFIAFAIFTSFYTDYLWYQSIDFTKVFTTQLTVKAVLFIVFGVLMAAVVAVNFVVAHRNRPGYAPLSPEQQNLERYRVGIEPFRRAIVIGISVVLGLFAGSAAAGGWERYLLWRHGASFGVKDPQFGMDLSFFTFDLPFYRFLLNFAFAIVVISLLVATATHYLYGGLRLQSAGDRTSPAARVHISLLLGIFVLLKAVAYLMDRWSLATKSGHVGATDFVGLTYTDRYVVLPAKLILAAIALICAILFFVNIFRRGWLLAGIGAGLLLLCAIIVGSLAPAIVQRFTVKPSAPVKESTYIAREITGTRQAYNITSEKSKVTDYTADTSVTAGQLRNDADTIPGIRLIDPNVVPDTFKALQQVKGFYDFPQLLDVDRYTIDGKEQDSVVGVRELNLGGLNSGQQNWANQHINYTHGFGFVAAKGNAGQADGSPDFIESNIPPTGDIGGAAGGGFEPRVYFGEETRDYSIVGGPSGGTKQEIDYPDDASPTGNRNTTYTGSGGVAIGSLFRQVLYAAKNQEPDILLSSLVNSKSKILYDREPRDRVQKAAPWLKLDGNTYPAVVKGRIVWILDGYTTTDNYPYSQRTSLKGATEDTFTNRSNIATQQNEQVNYIRNSVKATVDAYDGTVTLYEWDTQDPVLKTWMRAFPGTVKSRSAVSEELMAHLRYPEDLFKVQRTLLAQYHVSDPQAFYSGADFWKVPDDPTVKGSEQPPYYLTLRMPGQLEPTFSLTTNFVPLANRSNLTAFAAVDAQPGDDYGTIRTLTLPRNTTVPGPGQVQNNFESNTAIATQLSLLRQGGSTVKTGNLLTLPVGGGLLYVEPIYVQAAGGTSYPLLRKVSVAFGDKIGFSDTLQGALDSVFSGNSGTSTDEPTAPSGGTPSPTPTGSPSPTPSGSSTPEPGLQAALADMQSAEAAAEAALAAGDFTAYGQAQTRLRAALARAVAAAGATPSPAVGTPAATPVPSASPSAGALPTPSASPSG